MKKCVAKAVCAVVLSVLAVAGTAHAEDFKKFGVRMRAVYVKPDEGTNFSAAKVGISDDIVPELDLEYFFLKNVSAELIAAVTRHDIKLDNNFAGSTWLLPPTVTAKYHPFAGNTISPYAGFGVNFIFPFNSKISGVDPDFTIDNSVGWAAQAGADFKINENLYLNVDYKYLSVETKMKVGPNTYDLNLNPHLIGIGAGYRF